MLELAVLGLLLVAVAPLLAWWAAIKGYPVPPALNLDLLWVVVTGMLGLAGDLEGARPRGWRDGGSRDGMTSHQSSR